MNTGITLSMSHHEKLVFVLFCTCYFCLGGDSPGENMKTGYERSEKVVAADLALAVFNRKFSSRAAIISCNSEANRAVFRKMATRIPTSIVTPTTMWRLERMYFRVGVLFATDNCPTANSLLLEIQPYINSSYNWLVIGEESNFKGLSLRFDSSITAALRRVESYKLVDIYYDPVENRQKVLDVGRFVTKPKSALEDWVDAENTIVRSRVNRAVKAGVLVLNASEWSPPFDLERFNLPRGHPRVASTHIAMKHFNVYQALVQLYNISTTFSFYDKSGFNSKSVNTTYIFTYLLGALQKQALEISATNLVPYPERIARIDFLATCDRFSAGVVYYVGRSAVTPTALLDPFSTGLWLSVGASIILGIVALYFSGSLEMTSTQVPVDGDLSLGATALVMIGIFTGQGHPMELQWNASRFVRVVLLWMGFVVASAYSALIIRALLSAPSPNIRFRGEFLRSALSLAVEDYFAFTKIIFGTKMDELNRELYEKKVRPPVGSGFRTVPDAFDGMLAQRWAMFAQVNNIKLEMTRATPQQICRLAWINELGHDDLLCPALKKRSEFKNIFNRGYVLALERGLYNREKKRHQAADAPCLAAFKRHWVPVKLELLVSAFGLLYAGALAGIFLCAFERLMALMAHHRTAHTRGVQSSAAPPQCTIHRRRGVLHPEFLD